MFARVAKWTGWRTSSQTDDAVCLDLDLTSVQSIDVTLSNRLQAEDVWFQLQHEVTLQLIPAQAPYAFDYTEVPAPSAVGHSQAAGHTTYRVYAVPQAWVQLMQAIAQKHQLTLQRLGLHRHQGQGNASILPIDFLPHRQRQWRRDRHLWWWRSVLALLVGVAVVMVWQKVRVGWEARSYASASQRDATTQAIAKHQGELSTVTQQLTPLLQAQQQWSQHQAHQQRQAQWQRVLQHVDAGVWLQQFKLDGTHWALHGQALTESDVQRLQRQLQTLTIWQQAPRIARLSFSPASDSAHLPVWQFELVGTLLSSDASTAGATRSEQSLSSP